MRNSINTPGSSGTLRDDRRAHLSMASAIPGEGSHAQLLIDIEYYGVMAMPAFSTLLHGGSYATAAAILYPWRSSATSP